ncbi:MAG: DUF6179 domain-containing protein [Lachnospiraceae bacterium]|nr:DUF6179 domain-containing protein [Lachnospiraceae bacterium]
MKMNYEMEELLPIVAKLTEKYTSKESTSITLSKAKQLMGAVQYCINETYQSEVDTKELQTLYEKESAKSRYERGYQIVIKKAKRVKEEFESLVTSFESYGNRNYYDTIVKGMPAFFLHYDARFEPQNHILTLDYPTIVQLDGKCGIDAIEYYLKCIQLEQLFLHRFSENYIRTVLRAYHEDYEDMFFNICNIVYRNMIGCMILRKKDAGMGLNSEEVKKITQIVNRMDRKELQEYLDRLTDECILHQFANNQLLGNYLKADIADFNFELENVAKNNCMERMFFVQGVL